MILMGSGMGVAYWGLEGNYRHHILFYLINRQKITKAVDIGLK